jgi:outer membrane protein assembly factor BamB
MFKIILALPLLFFVCQVMAGEEDRNKDERCFEKRTVHEYAVKTAAFFQRKKEGYDPTYGTGSPTVMKDGSIAVAVNLKDGFSFHLINQDGTDKKSSMFSGRMITAPAVMKDGTIVIAGSEGLYFMSPDFETYREVKSTRGYNSSAAITPDGLAVIGDEDGVISFFHSNGTKKASFKTQGSIQSSPAIMKDGTVVIGSDDGHVYFLNPDGTLKAKFKTGDKVRSSPAITSDGTVVIGSVDENIYFLNPDATLKTSYKTQNVVSASPVVLKDGTIVIGAGDGNVYFFNPDGTKRASYNVGGSIDTLPTVMKDGTVVVTSRNEYVYFLNPDATLKASYNSDNSLFTSPAVTDDGTVVIGHYSGVAFLKVTPKILNTKTVVVQVPCPKAKDAPAENKTQKEMTQPR